MNFLFVLLFFLKKRKNKTQATRLREYKINRTSYSKHKILDWSCRKLAYRTKNVMVSQKIFVTLLGLLYWRMVTTFATFSWKAQNKILYMEINFRKRQIHLTFQMVKKTPIKLKETFWKEILHEKLLNNVVEMKIIGKHKTCRF